MPGLDVDPCLKPLLIFVYPTLISTTYHPSISHQHFTIHTTTMILTALLPSAQDVVSEMVVWRWPRRADTHTLSCSSFSCSSSRPRPRLCLRLSSSSSSQQPQPKFKGQIILPPPLSAQLPDTPPQTPDVHPIFVTSQLDNTMSSNPRIDSGVAQRRPIEREMSEIHLPTLEQAQEDAMRDAQARFQSYHAQASQRAAAAATAAAIGSGSGSTSHGNDVVDLSHSPGPPAYQTLQDSPNIIKPSHSSNLSTSSSPSPSIYSSPLSVHTDLHHYSPQSSISSPLHTPKGHPIELYERDGGVLGTAGQGLLNMVNNVTTGNMQKDGGGGTFGALKGFVGGDKGKGTDEKKWVGSYGQKVSRL